MQLQQLLVSCLLATIGTAAPLEDGVQVSKRHVANALVQKRAPVSGEHCGSGGDAEDYHVSWVLSAFGRMETYVNSPGDVRPSAGTRTYPLRNEARDPEVAAALNAIPGCETGQAGKVYWEFPLTNGVWNGGPERSQGPDRVIGIGSSPGTPGGFWALTYCLSVTHRGTENNANVPCTDSD